jgi:cation:H+ antiporter
MINLIQSAPVLLVAGLVLLVAGAEALVRGASKLAAAVGISPLVIGLTVVAFGTSAPEMAVSTMSGLTGQANIALGNIVGSNIFNILLILGLSALVAPLVVSQRLVKLDVPLMIAASLAVYLFALNGVVSRPEGIVLFAGIIAYTVFLIRASRRETKAVKEEYAQEYGEKEPLSLKLLSKDFVMILLGLGLLMLGSKWLVNGAVLIAARLGVSDLVIGLTIVAAGTSMPELATSVVASLRGERDIAVGNVVGSCLFNLLAVMGLAGMVSRGGIAVSPSALHVDLPVMILASVSCLPIFFTGSRISRREGLLFLCGYIAYTAYLILTAARS